MTVLVAGGAGYIGAHIVDLLTKRDEKVVIVDDFSTSTKDRVADFDYVELDLASGGSEDTLVEIMQSRDVDSVIHFAARKQVGESVEKPAWYYQQNVGGLANMLAAMQRADVDVMIFSSSAAVYGMPDVETVPEDIDCRPINPYGETKLIGEWMMADCERAWGLKWAGLRYFNVAGAGSEDLGDPAILNLVPMVFARLEKGQQPLIFGDDYPTPDGTCIRDYIHVVDLADAHITALDALRSDAPPAEHIFNVGTGQGSSVKEVVDVIGEVTGLDATPEFKDRRAGDPPKLIAKADRIREHLGWAARHDLADMVDSAWKAWRARH
ncbi:UDP-glucose 4-epimerase GalE [Bowdeniella nasicola]|uniref:UDP-glucose 4-epimerase n=1 Tax=Bowdeniella nasicola TaxID=208480 RepID=A0A1Q5Q2Z3_9ACTO|nr:UDP-glucose 4-epimerase GalE [Bowdeniella nasicola]OKL54010.1 UDP-glucose 4-epimerase GalE [Bowdeniella nasicola]